MNRKVFLKAIKYFASLGFAFVILYFLFRNQDPLKLIEEIRKVDVKWVILSMIFGGCAIVNRGLRWIVLIDALGYKSSKKNAVSAVAILYFTNLFIPRGGEITRCTSLNQVEKIPVDKLFGTILVERIIDFIFLFALIFLTIILKFNALINFYTAVQSQQTESSGNNNLILTLIIISTLTIGFVLLKKMAEEI